MSNDGLVTPGLRRLQRPKRYSAIILNYMRKVNEHELQLTIENEVVLNSLLIIIK